jgi:CRP-like cAMP-binding protein
MSTTQRAEQRNPAAAAPAVSANHVYSALQREFAALGVDAEVVNLCAGDVVLLGGTELDHVHLPLNCVLSMLTVMSDNRAVEFATVGREGVVGANELLSGVGMSLRVICQVPGAAARVPAHAIADLVQSNGRARTLLQRHAQFILVQAAQIAACNRLHPVEERCARWLLMTHDRVGRDDFLLTQEFLSQMLGVRRARVNVAAGILQRAGLIRYTRGRLRLTDRAGLEAAACECYDVLGKAYERLAGEPLRPKGSS